MTAARPLTDAERETAACPACGVAIAEPTVNPPPEARCYRDWSVIPGCRCEPARARCRGDWPRAVLKPLPPDEADALAAALDCDREAVGMGEGEGEG
jgi:hypothetical protein